MRPIDIVASETESYIMIIGSTASSVIVSDSTNVLTRAKVIEKKTVGKETETSIHLKIKLEAYMQAADTEFAWVELESPFWAEVQYPSSVIHEDTDKIIPMSEDNLVTSKEAFIADLQTEYNERVTSIQGISYEEVSNTN